VNGTDKFEKLFAAEKLLLIEGKIGNFNIYR